MRNLIWTIICYAGLLLIAVACIYFPPLILLFTVLMDGPMPWNREKESGISGDL